jgi:hypothetical protein
VVLYLEKGTRNGDISSIAKWIEAVHCVPIIARIASGGVVYNVYA